MVKQQRISLQSPAMQIDKIINPFSTSVVFALPLDLLIDAFNHFFPLPAFSKTQRN